MYIYWEYRRVSAWATAKGGHHDNNEYNGSSSPILLSTHAWSGPPIAVLNYYMNHPCPESTSTSPLNIDRDKL